MSEQNASKVALVTGGSGSIGQAICTTFAAQGYKVAFTYHQNEQAARELAGRLGEHTACCFEGLETTDGAAITAFVERVESELGPIDALVNNIGSIQVLPFALIEQEDWDACLTTNLSGLFLFSKAVIRSMIRRRSGSIVNVGSIAGHRMLEVPVHYATAKAAVSGFTISLAKELARYQIRVNEVIPGLIEGGIGGNISEKQLEQYKRYCAMGRPGTAQEVADLVTFVAGERASYINAQQLTVDGGL